MANFLDLFVEQIPPFNCNQWHEDTIIRSHDLSHNKLKNIFIFLNSMDSII